MSELTIKHDREDGTLIYGTARGDGTAEILKANRWRWSPNLGMWFVPSSRDRAAKTGIIRATETALKAAGFAVTVEIDDTYRPTALVEADRAGRQADRVEALHEKAERRHGQAAAALAADIRATEALPPGGEPIKIGHHSEGRHRRALDKAWAATGKRIAAEDAAREAARRAEASEHTTEFRNNPRVTLRRIKRLEAELASTERSRDGYTRTLFTHPQTGQKVTEEHAPATGERRERLEASIAELEDKLAYWRGVVEQAKAAGVVLYERSMIRVGDTLRSGRLSYKAVRVNAKSVSIESEWGGTYTIGYDTITAVINAEGQKVTYAPDGTRSDGK